MIIYPVPHGLLITTCRMCFKRGVQVPSGTGGHVLIDYDANKPQSLLDEPGFPLRRPELDCRRAGCPFMLGESEADNAASQ
jgi:hypothetical protein